MHINMFLNFSGIYLLRHDLAHLGYSFNFELQNCGCFLCFFFQAEHVCVLNLGLPVPIMLRNIIFWKFLKITSLVRRYFSQNAL